VTSAQREIWHAMRRGNYSEYSQAGYNASARHSSAACKTTDTPIAFPKT